MFNQKFSRQSICIWPLILSALQLSDCYTIQQTTESKPLDKLHNQNQREVDNQYSKYLDEHGQHFNDNPVTDPLEDIASISLSTRDVEAVEPGDMGAGVLLDNYNRGHYKLVEDGYAQYGFNKYVSDLVPYNRTLPDYRNKWCKKDEQNAELLKATVIISFHNEATSTLMRSLHSIVNRSKTSLLNEIILVNDFSDSISVDKLNLKKAFPNTDIRVIQTFQREGVARARTLGAVNAQGPVLIFLDSHVEVTKGWLEPLLESIVHNDKTVVAPTVDIIDSNTFQYKASNWTLNRIGTFDWKLQIKWRSTQKALANPGKPVQTPVIPFGMFAIHKTFFESLGHFDTGFDKWGGEALELSFKVWMCGGRVLITSCSHIGHVFKQRKLTEHTQALHTNLNRLALSWMGDHAKYFNKGASMGGVSSRLAISKNLKCKPFSWYMQNIAPEVFNPELSVADGELRNQAFGSYLCMDAGADIDAVGVPAGVWPCHQFGGNQHWHYSNHGELRRMDLCLDQNNVSRLIMNNCHGSKTQNWLYDDSSRQIRHPLTSKCIAMNGLNELHLEYCDSKAVLQKWDFTRLYQNRLEDVKKILDQSITYEN